ncbi:penicillin acylase family protein [Nocardioides sp.]|uniref:penicillin acylase family protein n=1 Tax=Nocardioides sp. TaxID=35761 RepID=UPI0035131065
MTDATPTREHPDPPRRWRRWRREFAALPRAFRATAWVALTLVLCLVAGLVVGTVVVRRSFPQTTGTLVVPGLAGPVEVRRDASGVPRLEADSADDLFLAQGFVAAQDRFFEMDVRRHVASGRLAELVGEQALAGDLVARTLGWRRVAAAELPLLDPATRDALESYAAGVNAYLADRGPSELALEYTALGLGGLDYTPEPWTPIDSLAWLKAFGWELSGNLEQEVQRVLAQVAVGPTRAGELFPPTTAPGTVPIVRTGAVVDGVFEADATAAGTRNPVRPAPFARTGASTGAPASPARRVAPLMNDLAGHLARVPALAGRGDGVGSNAWAVSGDHTDTGAPLLAADPHLTASLPGIWWQVGLRCRTVSSDCPYDVAGAAFAGVPGVVTGHNADLGWAFASLGADVTDLYVEQVRGSRWRRGTAWEPLRTRRETIAVQGADDVVVTVRATAHGPLLSDVDDLLATVAETAPEGRRGSATVPREVEYVLAVAWAGADPAPTADALLALNRAADPGDVRAATADLALPALSVVYADRAGHIGYQAAGRLPIRRSGHDGTVPVAGWRPENDWTGDVVPAAALPQVTDPADGFVVAANQRAAGEDYPYLITQDWDRGYRAQRARESLERAVEADEAITAADLEALQRDTRHPIAADLVPALLAVPLPDGYASSGRDLLRSWDFTQSADSAAAAYFNAVWSRLLADTFHDELPAAAWPDGGQRWFGVVPRLLAEPDSAWWDDVRTPEREDRDAILARALTEARDDLTRLLDVDPARWRWGRLHTLELRSPGLRGHGSAWLRRLVDRTGPEVGGGVGALDATAWDARAGFAVTTAPAMRMVVDLDDLDRSRWIVPAGVSGHAFHPHATDQLADWAAGRTRGWPFGRDAVAAATRDTLRLTPPDPG